MNIHASDNALSLASGLRFKKVCRMRIGDRIWGIEDCSVAVCIRTQCDNQSYSVWSGYVSQYFASSHLASKISANLPRIACVAVHDVTYSILHMVESLEQLSCYMTPR